MILGVIREALTVVRNYILSLQGMRALLALFHQAVKRILVGSEGDKFEEWSASEKFIERSKNFDSLNYTLIILDAIKQGSRND